MMLTEIELTDTGLIVTERPSPDAEGVSSIWHYPKKSTPDKDTDKATLEGILRTGDLRVLAGKVVGYGLTETEMDWCRRNRRQAELIARRKTGM